MNKQFDIEDEILKSQELFGKGKIDSYFKYVSDNKDVFNGIFVDHKIRFTQPRALNDPLEFNPSIHFHDDKSNYQQYILDDILLPSVAVFYRVQILESQINHYGILSLTKKPDSFNMWSQYSNGHRGYIIELTPDFNLDPTMKSKNGEVYDVKKIDYVDDYTICLDDLADASGYIPKDALLNELFFKKTFRWKHENEYRLVRPLSDLPEYEAPKNQYIFTDTNAYLFPFDLTCISSIILGACMSQEMKARIIEICEKNGIVLHQAHIIRDIEDRFGESSTMVILHVDKSKNEVILNSKPQLFCSDKTSLNVKGNPVKINDISELPYYKDYKNIVDALYSDLRKS